MECNRDKNILLSHMRSHFQQFSGKMTALIDYKAKYDSYFSYDYSM